MLLILGLLGLIYPLYLILPIQKIITKNVTPLLIRLASLFLVLELLNIGLNLSYIQDEVLFLDGIHRLNTNILIYQLLLISFSFLLFQVYTYYLKSSETFMIIFTNVIAILNLIESYDWLLTIVNYELINITLYLIVSIKNGSEKAISASIKYFLLSALTTTFFLLFITLIYALTGTLHWDNMGLLWIFIEKDLKLPLFFMLITIFFKIGAAPFHNWSPDLLDAIPTVLTSWMATIPKFGILLFLSLFSYFWVPTPDLESGGIPINYFILFIANISILVGSIGLSSQWRIKRFLAYSAISNIGFLLLALVCAPLELYVSYLIIYALTSIGIFMILVHIGPTLDQQSGFCTLSIGEAQVEPRSHPGTLNHELIAYRVYDQEMILQLSGIYHQNAFLGLSLTFLLFSLMGLPPMAGFFAKLMVLASTINLGYISLALFAILGSIISSVNYLNLIKIINVNLPMQRLGEATLPIALGRDPLGYFNALSVSKEISYYLSIIVAFTVFFLFYPLNLFTFGS
uniref:NADH-ubiquinone oxidoreductase chain 2 n=1 Tax=Synchytrium taraxaci TaxID=1383262 RepID=A0A4P8NPT0_9FUNG|nr:NADH dehydrogenase subunit 2 [Synchytrium taraxaci]